MNGLGKYMTEAQFTDTVVKLAQFNGWRAVHFRPARTKEGWRTAMTGDRGFVDVVLARRGVVLHIELKKQDGAMRAGQREWAEEIGDSYRLWRPSDMETIKQELR
jgi:hypothetical protein